MHYYGNKEILRKSGCAIAAALFILLGRELVCMKLSDHLDKNTKSRLNNIKDNKKSRYRNKRCKKTKEKFSERDIRELMGEFKDTYKRSRGGAIRRK